MTNYENWGIRKFARHYVETRLSATGLSKIFGAPDRIVFMATVKFGQAEVDRVFREEITKVAGERS